MKFKPLVIILAVVLALTVSSVALATTTLWGSSHEDGIGYHWNASDLTIDVGDQSGIYDPLVHLDELNESGATFEGFPSSSTFDTVVKDGKMGRPFLGSARVRLDENGHILKGEVELNTFFYGPDEPWWGVVICQELLHILGLNHSNEDKSCMNTEDAVDRAESEEGWDSPGTHDIESLLIIYPIAPNSPHTEPVAAPEPTQEPDNGGPDCTKNTKPKKCQEGAGTSTSGGTWITVHKFPAPGY